MSLRGPVLCDLDRCSNKDSMSLLIPGSESLRQIVKCGLRAGNVGTRPLLSKPYLSKHPAEICLVSTIRTGQLSDCDL